MGRSDCADSVTHRSRRGKFLDPPSAYPSRTKKARPPRGAAVPEEHAASAGYFAPKSNLPRMPTLNQECVPLSVIEFPSTFEYWPIEYWM